jgi:hypothetical protein
MIDDTGSDLYLIYGTRNRKGLEKMKEAMWHVDPVQGVHYRDPRDPNQITLELDFAVPHLEPLQEALMRELARGDRPLDSLREYALLETVYRPRTPVRRSCPSSGRGQPSGSRQPAS